MRNLSVKHTLAVVQGLMLAALLAIAATGIMTKLDVMESLRRVDEIAAQQVSAINRAEVNLMELRVRLGRFNEYSEDGNTVAAQKSLDLARTALERAESRFAQFTAVEVPSTALRAPIIQTLQTNFELLVTNDLRSDLATENLAILMSHRDRINDNFGPFTDAVRNFNQRAQTLATEEITAAERLHTITMFISGVLIFLALALFIGVRIGINRIIVLPLQRAVQLCENIAKGVSWKQRNWAPLQCNARYAEQTTSNGRYALPKQHYRGR
jgi:hypothetical protein